jgi:D-alanyl-lipoteichoic acid acyltransferase DltB (MBOAT superfamily)
MVSGIWHGANWTYVIWGALHGFYLIFALSTKNISAKVSKWFNTKARFFVLNTFNVAVVFALTAFAWIFFRAATINDAIYIMKHMFDFSSFSINKDIYLNHGQDFFVTSLVLVLILELVQYINANHNQILFNTRLTPARWAFTIAILLLICVFGVFHRDAEFIYFQF